MDNVENVDGFGDQAKLMESMRNNLSPAQIAKFMRDIKKKKSGAGALRAKKNKTKKNKKISKKSKRKNRK